MKPIKPHPLTLLAINLIVPVVLMIKTNLALNIVFLAWASFVLIFAGKLKRLAKFLMYLALLFFLRVPFSHYCETPVFAFFSMASFLTVQFFPLMMNASILIIDYTPADLISALQILHLPKIFIVMIAIFFRYLPTLKKEFYLIKQAMYLRGIPYTLKKPLQTFEYILVPQLFRSASLAEEIAAAGLVKGMTNPIKRTSFIEIKFRLYDIFLLVIFSLSTAGVFVWF